MKKIIRRFHSFALKYLTKSPRSSHSCTPQHFSLCCRLVTRSPPTEWQQCADCSYAAGYASCRDICFYSYFEGVHLLVLTNLTKCRLTEGNEGNINRYREY